MDFDKSSVRGARYVNIRVTPLMKGCSGGLSTRLSRRRARSMSSPGRREADAGSLCGGLGKLLDRIRAILARVRRRESNAGTTRE